MKEKIIETKTCKQCSCDFTITDKDLEFYKKISPKFGGETFDIPSPTLCSGCRQQRRLSFINERNLYKGKCEKCEENIISRFHPESGVHVYCNACWSSDSHDLLQNGLELSLNRSIFDQIKLLTQITNFQNLIGSFSNLNNNSTYTNHTADINNSYMMFESDGIDKGMYSRGMRTSESIVDCLNCSDSQEIYECVDCSNMYKSYYCYNSSTCNNSYYLSNCLNCSFCIGCTNLSGKQYYILNQKVTQKEYEQYLDKINENEITKIEKFLEKSFKKQYVIIGSDNCSGNYIISSKNAQESYDILSCQDVKYCSDVNHSEDLMDVSSYGSKSYLMYESVSVGRYSNNVLFSSIVGKGENLFYCIEVKKSKDCFACVNLKDCQYCILNKQYTKQEYNMLVPKIIEAMKQNGEWGEFFPSILSLFGYNESIAQEHFPINSQGSFNWSHYKTPTLDVEKVIPASKLPKNIQDIPEDILNWAVECELTQKPFKIVKQELDFYRKHNLPIPKRHPDQRYKERMSKRNARELFEQNCSKCQKKVQTTYSPGQKYIVYCEECYDKEMY